jgi:uncharacterized protein (DUF2062 family)/2-polyprenyl-3-methyl-5-hydroxy-6-metoxy-1,4-benzoquinol methylase
MRHDKLSAVPITGRIRELWGRVVHEHTGPLRLGGAVALGIVIGCSPFFGLHLWIGLGLAVLLRLNKVAVFLGSQISIPPIAPLLGFASVQLGSLLLHGRWLLLAPADFALSRLPGLLRGFFLSWLLGGLLIGVGLAVPAFVITALLVRWRRSRAPGEAAWRDQLRAVRRAFASAPRGHRGYVTGKLAMDPVYRQVCEGLGPVQRAVDLGTGLGLLPLLLAVRGQARELVGVDWDSAKLESARLAAGRLSCPASLRFEHGDVRSTALPEADAVFLVDVLHYYPLDEQRALLARAAALLRPGGRLILRETDREARSLLTRLIEALAVRLRWNKGPGLTFRSGAELAAELEPLGLRCRREGASSVVHRGNILLWAERPGEAGARGALPGKAAMV